MKKDKRIVEYTVNGDDSLAYLNSRIGCTDYLLTFNEEKYTETRYTERWITVASDDTSCSNNISDGHRNLYWNFDNEYNKNKFLLSVYSDKFLYEFNYWWDIERLTVNDLWLYKVEGGKEYYMKLKSD